MRTPYLYLLLFIFSFSIAKSQNTFRGLRTPYSSWEIGVFGGESYYLGEVNQTHFVPFNLAFGPIVRYNYDQRLSFKAALKMGTIEGDDSKSSSTFNQDRNFAFTSELIEISGLMELNFFPFSALDDKAYIVSPYGFIGLAYLNHNPQANFNGIKISTNNLATEGNTYSKHLMTIPMGLGIKFRMNRFGLGINWGIRKTFTDYLDDVSTFYLPANSSSGSAQQNIANSTQYSNVDNIKRGDQYSKDWYVFTGLTLFVNLTPKRVCPSFE